MCWQNHAEQQGDYSAFFIAASLVLKNELLAALSFIIDDIDYESKTSSTSASFKNKV